LERVGSPMDDELIIHPNGIWEGFVEADDAHCFDEQLCNSLCKFFSREKARSVIDFGCGTGEYVRKIRADSKIICDGIDGNPYTPALSKGMCRIQDLSIPFQLNRNYDWVLSLEVGEHLPKQYEEIFIDNLIRHAEKGIVLSWAIVGHGGYGHINEQSNDYIKAILKSKGWINDVVAENRLRKAANPIYYWFKDTIMVFRK
jgi:cyclopropane fatty-acyl-phospholipid synthase-like methyltransferase